MMTVQEMKILASDFICHPLSRGITECERIGEALSDAAVIIAARNKECADLDAECTHLRTEVAKLTNERDEALNGYSVRDDEVTGLIGMNNELRTEVERLVTAIDEQMTSTHIGVFNLGDDPAEAIGKLMLWSQGVGEYFATEKCEEALAAIEQLGKEKS